MKIEVHVAAMHQSDLSIYEKMNINTDAIIANQCDTNKFDESIINGKTVKMVSTNTRGVGKNRNFALMYSKGDIILFSDMDLTYYDGYERVILDEFESLPNADAIIFGLIYTRDGKFIAEIKNTKKRVHIYNGMKYGTAGLAVKSKAVKKYNLHFSELFGGGCIYGSGEDSIFILDLLKSGCKVYSSDKIIAKCARDKSSWFEGYNDKYMYDRGALIASCFPKMKSIVKWYFPFRFRQLSEMNFGSMIKYINYGIEGFDDLKSFKRARG